jgi:hypothetical protein
MDPADLRPRQGLRHPWKEAAPLARPPRLPARGRGLPPLPPLLADRGGRLHVSTGSSVRPLTPGGMGVRLPRGSRAEAIRFRPERFDHRGHRRRGAHPAGAGDFQQLKTRNFPAPGEAGPPWATRLRLQRCGTFVRAVPSVLRLQRFQKKFPLPPTVIDALPRIPSGIRPRVPAEGFSGGPQTRNEDVSMRKIVYVRICRSTRCPRLFKGCPGHFPARSLAHSTWKNPQSQGTHGCSPGLALARGWENGREIFHALVKRPIRPIRSDEKPNAMYEPQGAGSGRKKSGVAVLQCHGRRRGRVRKNVLGTIN